MSRTLTLGCRVVYLCRDPKDVLGSCWYYIQKVDKTCFIEFDKAFEVLNLWSYLRALSRILETSKVLFLKYDEMMSALAKHVKMLAEFVGVPFTDQECDGWSPGESGGVV
ncbi:hypothetical protein EJB05_55514, partial [Eragrostis curvula]